jgi:hypothetical protein
VACSRAPVVARLHGDHAVEPARPDYERAELRTRLRRPVLCQRAPTRNHPTKQCERSRP